MTEQRVFTARDDRFHFAEMGNGWWATETLWFSFNHPERRLGGWFYTMARPNIGTVAGGAWIWDHTAHLPCGGPVLSKLQCPSAPTRSRPERHHLTYRRLNTGD